MQLPNLHYGVVTATLLWRTCYWPLFKQGMEKGGPLLWPTRVPLASVSWFVGTFTPHKAPQKAQERQLIAQLGKKIPHEALKCCSQWVSSREARKATEKNFPGLAAHERYFTALFVFSFLKQAGLGSLISVTYGGCTTLPVCVGINTLNTLTAVMCSFQGKIPGGHETEMGRLRGNMVYRELPSRVMGKLPFCISGLAQHKCFYLVALLSCRSHSVTMHSNTYPRTIIISDLPTTDVHCFLNISTEATITVNRILHNRGYQTFT